MKPILIIGVDPDSDRHGVAVFNSDGITGLYNLNTIQLYEFLKYRTHHYNIVINLENVKINSPSWRRSKNKAEERAIAQRVGMNKQAQTNVEQVAEALDIPVILRKPSSQWKKNAPLFKLETGWTKRSNPDTRSGAWFAYVCWREWKAAKKI